MDKIRWHGRGGAGVVTAARLLGAGVALYENKNAQSFPAFGPERRGAPVLAFTKISSKPIRDRSQIEDPDCVVVLDSSLLSVIDVFQGLKKGATVIINAAGELEDKEFPPATEIITIDATGIAIETMGVPIVNTAMLGAVAAGTHYIRIESLKKVIADEFRNRGKDGQNIAAAEAAYQIIKEGVS